MFRTLTPIFSIIIALAVFFTFTRPTIDTIRAFQNEASDYQEAADKATEYNQLLQSYITTKNSFGARELERLESLVPYSVDEVRLLVDLEDIVRRHGMVIGDVSVEAGVPVDLERSKDSAKLTFENDFDYSDISLDLIGTYEQFKQVLADIEQSLVLIEVVDLSFQVTEINLQNYNLTLRAYALASTE
ncbi:hypothetical protein KC727_00395 [Candidatus Kaiserbacteria bacterium]|nr:hypothetical protein [Candidatus Kaiserbacteria bacterium]